MEGLAPSLNCLVEMQSAIRNGETVRAGVSSYLLKSPPHEEYSQQLRALLFAWDQEHSDWRSALHAIKGPHRRALAELLCAGLAGQSILSQLNELRDELVRASEIELKAYVDLLPLKMLVPLLLFQFPAFLTLLFGPLLSKFIQELSR